MKNKKYILVLSGGGAKGAFQVGALKYIYKNGLYHYENQKRTLIKGAEIKFDYIAGVSAGSLNATMVAVDQSYERLEKLWKDTIAGHPEEVWTSKYIDANLKLKKNILKVLLSDVGFFKKIGLLVNSKKRNTFIAEKIKSIKAIASNEPLRNKIIEIIKDAKIEGTVLKVGCVSLDTGEYHSFKHSQFKNNDELAKAVLASSSMPIIWEPVESISAVDKNGNQQEYKNMVDGGIRNVSPLGDIIENIEEDSDFDYHVIIINNHSNKLAPPKEEIQDFIKIAYRSLVDITLNEIFINDIREFTKINKLVDEIEQAKAKNQIPNSFEFVSPNKKKKYKKFYYHLIEPNISMGKTLDFSAEEIERRIDHGYDRAKQVINPEPIASNTIASNIGLSTSPPGAWDV